MVEDAGDFKELGVARCLGLDRRVSLLRVTYMSTEVLGMLSACGTYEVVDTCRDLWVDQILTTTLWLLTVKRY